MLIAVGDLIRRHRKRLVFGAFFWVGIAVGISLIEGGAVAIGVAAFTVGPGLGLLAARQIRTPAGVWAVPVAGRRGSTGM